MKKKMNSPKKQNGAPVRANDILSGSRDILVRAIRPIRVIRDRSFHSESGAVLVVVLGILALLTVIAVSFVFASRMSMRASESFMHTVTADDIAEAGLANAIAVLEADKIYRVGDSLAPGAPITETYDSLRDSWRQVFSAPVVITYTDTVNDANLAVGDTVVNVISTPPPGTPPPRYEAQAKVISIDRNANLIYLNSVSAALWQVNDEIVEKDDSTGAGTEFDTTITAVSKPDVVDLDGDSNPDAIWQNYYDDSGALLGRYAVLVQDEASKINVNVSGNLALTAAASSDYSSTGPYSHAADEGWSTYEINLQNGLSPSASNPNFARNIVMYRNGFPVGAVAPPTPPSWNYSTMSGPARRIYVPGQGDISGAPPANPAAYDDDDNNSNRYFYEHDGIDNDGDGTIDEGGEGLYEPEEFRPLRPVRTRPEVASGGRALDYDGIDNDSDGLVDEANECDDQPILTAEQLEDPNGLNMSGFLTENVSTNFDGVTNSNRERRNFISTLSNDRNLNKQGRLRVNPNFAPPDQLASTIRDAYPDAYPSPTGPVDSDPYELPDLRNLQVAANMYDYRDRTHGRTEIQDSAGDTFAGVEAIRINEVLVRAATSVYEAELAAVSGTWDLYSATDPNPYLYGAKSPLPNGVWISDYLRNLGGSASAAEASNPISIVLPNPPFSTAGPYAFKLRIRVRSDGGATNSADNGFEVYLNPVGGPPFLPTDPAKVNPATGINSSFGSSTIPGRWATQNTGTGANNWYIEEALVWLNGAGATNTLYFQTPAPTAPSTTVDTIDIDYLYFSQEPDCEWIELANLSNTEDISVQNWKLVTDYVMDVGQVQPPVYAHVRYQVTLPSVIVPRIDQDYSPTGPAAPQYVVFVIDKNDSGGSGATSGNNISFANTWTTIAASLNYQNVHQIQSVYNIYSTWIDFFGDEPLDDNTNYTGPIGVRGEYGNVESGMVSLYDAANNLVDRVTYTLDQVREGFRSLQRDHPANPGDRMDSTLHFKMKAFTGTWWDPIADYSVTSDGNYDDWQFRWDRGPTGSLPDPERYLWLWSTPTQANNLYADTTVTGAPNIANEYNDLEKRVMMPDCRVKDRYFTSPGELTQLPFYHEYIAAIGYEEPTGSSEDEKLVPGESVISNTTAGNGATLISVNPTNITTGTGEVGWMIVKGDASNLVNQWQKGQTIACSDLGATFTATIKHVKPLDRLMGSEMDHYLEIAYTLQGSSADPTVGDTITNESKNPDETGRATQVYVDSINPANSRIQLRMVPPSPVTDWKVTEWKPGETISWNAGSDTATIDSVREKTADVRGLADYFTTAAIDLEVGAANTYSATPSFTPAAWPDPNVGPYVLPDPVGTTNGSITWDEDGGVQEGTYDLYNVVNYGTGVDSEVPLYAGPKTIQRTLPTQQASLTVNLDNTGAAAAQYHFMRSVLTPPPFTFGRINVNTASQRVLQGLPGITAALATSIIEARNMGAFETVGDVYRVSEIDSNFTPTVFKNISNLITTRSDAYKVIVLGQGATDSNGDGIIQDSEVISQKKLELIYQR